MFELIKNMLNGTRTSQQKKAENEGKNFIKVGYEDKMTYSDGWFVLLDENGRVSVLTREDARTIERERNAYCISRSAEDNPGETPSIRDIEDKYLKGIYKYEVDTLSGSGRDVVIKDVLKIPETVGEYKVTAVHRNSFQNLKIKELVLPKGLEIIENGAFSGCTYLEKADISQKTVIMGNAFDGCPVCAAKDDSLILGNGFIKAGTNIPSEYVIPENVTYIKGGAFFGNPSVEKIIIKPNIQMIDANAFGDCYYLTSIEFVGEFPKIEFANYGVFRNCPNLERVVLPEGLKDVGISSFQKSRNVSEIVLPSTVSRVGMESLYDTKIVQNYLKSEDQYLYIGNWLINVKNKINEKIEVREGTRGIAIRALSCVVDHDGSGVVLPESVKIICNNAFEDAEIERIDLGCVEYIGDRAFFGCGLKEIRVPKTCKEVGMWFFNHRLTTEVYFYNPDTVINDRMTRKTTGVCINVHGYRGSTAEKHVKEFGETENLKFVPLD